MDRGIEVDSEGNRVEYEEVEVSDDDDEVVRKMPGSPSVHTPQSS
jgi:hypothetical protein